VVFVRKFVAFVFVALTVSVAAPASAVSWSVTPGGSFTASGNPDVSGQLEILPNPTLNITYFDPETDCFGFLDDTEYVTLDATLSVTPVQRIVAS
jgi:hypothetical protein